MKNRWQRSQLTYCTNVHPARNLPQVYDVIENSVAAVRRQRQLATMSAGLWISHANAQSVAADNNLQNFAAFLQHNGISLATLNGFPAQDLHQQTVKQAVYSPDWSEPERLSYTIKLAHILSELLDPNELEGTISTVPLGFAQNWSEERHHLALQAIGQCMVELDKLYQRTTRSIRLCLEMEPGCVLETTEQLIKFFSIDLRRYFQSVQLDEKLIDKHLGICFDVCHQAVMFEDSYKSLDRIHQANIHIGKIQISSALQLSDPTQSDARNSLAQFIENKYLHQSCCIDTQGQRLQVIDLDQAIESFPSNCPWRVHFHVPIQSRTLISKGLETTQTEICRTLDFLQHHPEIQPHLEVETYTWSALPESIRPKSQQMTIDGLTKELFWLEEQMRDRSLLLEVSE